MGIRKSIAKWLLGYEPINEMKFTVKIDNKTMVRTHIGQLRNTAYYQGGQVAFPFNARQVKYDQWADREIIQDLPILIIFENEK